MPWRPRALRVVVGVLIAAIVFFGIVSLTNARCFQLVGEVTCRVTTDRKIVALTFDDGPTSRGVDAVLPVLERFDAKATFFLIGEDIKEAPGEAEKILAAGHELGNHSFSHVRGVGRSQKFYRQEVRRTHALLERAGAEARLFRPPYGKRLVGLPIEVKRAGYRTIMWDVEDRAGHFDDPQAYADDILGRVRPGSIILIHPMYRGNGLERAALPLLLQGLADRGYRATSVSELLASASPD